MDSVGVDGQRHVDAIVHEHRGAVPFADLAHFERQSIEFTPFKVLLAELDGGLYSRGMRLGGGERPIECREQTAPRAELAIRNQVETKRGAATRSLGGQSLISGLRPSAGSRRLRRASARFDRRGTQSVRL